MGLRGGTILWWMSFTYQGQQVRRSTGTTDKRLAEAILGKVRAQIIEGRFFRRTGRATSDLEGTDGSVRKRACGETRGGNHRRELTSALRT